VYTREEIKERLRGYVPVASEHWRSIGHNSHVRFLKTSGEFNAGGFILKNPHFANLGGGNSRESFRLHSSPWTTSKGHFAWNAPYADVERVYVKATGAELTIQADLAEVTRTLTGNIRALRDYAKGLEARVAALEAGRP
jgi:hypothetical protein